MSKYIVSFYSSSFDEKIETFNTIQGIRQRRKELQRESRGYGVTINYVYEVKKDIKDYIFNRED